jgi:hypothetical protein
VIQTSLYYILKFIIKLPLTIPDYFSTNVFVLQLISALTVICIGMYVGHKRIGFDFVPDKPDVKIKPTPSEKILFTLNLPTLIVITSFIYFVNSFFFFLIPIFYGIILWGYLYLSYKKDRNNYESFST